VTSLADTPVDDRARSTVLVALLYISPLVASGATRSDAGGESGHGEPWPQV